MAAVGDLVVNLLGKTGQFENAMKRSRGTLVAFHTSALNVAKGVLGAFASLRVADYLARPIRSGDEFNRAMRNSTAVMVGLSDVMKGKMRTAALDVARTTKYSAAEAAKGFYYLASAGLDAEQQIAALPAVARFAQAGQFDLAKATELSMDALKSMGLESKDPMANMEAITRVTDVLARATTMANATTEQFSVSLAKAGPSLRIYNKSIEEGTAMLAVYADQGIKAEEAGTAVTQVLRDMARTATKFPAAFKNAGIAVFDAGGQMRNVADIVADFERKLGGLSDRAKTKALMDLGIPFKSVRALLTLLGKSNAIRQFQTELQKAGGYTEKVAKEQISPLERGMAAIAATATDIGSRVQSGVGSVLGPVFEYAASRMQMLYGWTVATYQAIANSPVGTFIREFLGVAAVGASLITVIGLVAKLGAVFSVAFTIATGPIVAFIALTTILGAAIVEATGKGETFGEKLQSVLSKIPDVIDTLAFTFRNFGAISQIALIDLVQSAIDLFPQMETPLTRVGEFFVSMFAGLKAFFGSIIQNIIGGLKEVANFAQAVGAGLVAAWDAIVAGEWSSVAERFGAAFTDTLAKQADVAAPNAFAAFRDAYQQAGNDFTESITREGGLKASLANQRQRLLDSVAQSETKRAAVEKVPAAQASAAGIVAGIPTVKAPEVAASEFSAKSPEAMERGSKESWSNIVSAMRVGGAKKSEEAIADNTERTAKAVERVAEHLSQNGLDDPTEIIDF